MPALQVRDCPQDLYDNLRQCATAEDRSIAQQNVHILREYLDAYNKCIGRPEFRVTVCDSANPYSSAVSLSASPNRETQDVEWRIRKRKALFDRIDARLPVEIPKDFPSSAELVRRMREERTEQLMPSTPDLENAQLENMR